MDNGLISVVLIVFTLLGAMAGGFFGNVLSGGDALWTILGIFTLGLVGLGCGAIVDSRR